MILPSEKLGQITRFGAKIIVVHLPHLTLSALNILGNISEV